MKIILYFTAHDRVGVLDWGFESSTKKRASWAAKALQELNGLRFAVVDTFVWTSFQLFFTNSDSNI